MSDASLKPTRRGVLTGAGAALAGGVALAAAPAAGADRGRVAVSPTGTTAVEFRGRIFQTGPAGQTFSSLGFLIAAAGLEPDDMFAGGAPAVGTSLFTAVASGELVARVLDNLVHALDIEGELTVYQRSAPGAAFTDPSSFSSGNQVARYHLILQDALAVIDPGKGVPTLTGDMRQAVADPLGGQLAGRRFGRVGQRLRLFATGLGELVDPVTLNADLEIVGNWTTV